MAFRDPAALTWGIRARASFSVSYRVSCTLGEKTPWSDGPANTSMIVSLTVFLKAEWRFIVDGQYAGQSSCVYIGQERGFVTNQAWQKRSPFSESYFHSADTVVENRRSFTSDSVVYAHLWKSANADWVVLSTRRSFRPDVTHGDSVRGKYYYRKVNLNTRQTQTVKLNHRNEPLQTTHSTIGVALEARNDTGQIMQTTLYW